MYRNLFKDKKKGLDRVGGGWGTNWEWRYKEGWEQRHIQGRATDWDRQLRREGGRLRGERGKVERVSYCPKRQKEKWLTRLTKG